MCDPDNKNLQTTHLQGIWLTFYACDVVNSMRSWWPGLRLDNPVVGMHCLFFSSEDFDAISHVTTRNAFGHICDDSTRWIEQDHARLTSTGRNCVELNLREKVDIVI